MDSCQAPGRSCQHLNFCFPGKTEHFYWLRTKELCWEASAVSFKFFFIFLSISTFFLGFSQQLLSSFKNRAKIQMFFTQMEQFSDYVTRKFGPLYFNCCAFMSMETYFLQNHGGAFGKFHKTYLWKIDINLRHFYAKWELWKIAKNNRNRKIYIWFCLECAMFSDFHFVYCTVFGFISLFLHFFS